MKRVKSIFFILVMMRYCMLGLAQTAYITNYDDNTVSVIDVASNTVSTTIAVGSYPFGVSVSPDGLRAYIANSGASSVNVINTATNTVIDTITVGSVPYGLHVSPDGLKVYVANWSGNTISVINTTTNNVSATIGLATYAKGVAVTPDGLRVYVTNSSANSVSVINTATNTVLTSILTGFLAPAGVTVTPDGSKVYVANTGNGTVSVINTTTNTVSTTIAVGSGPSGITASPDGSKIYVANINSSSVSLINTATNTVTTTITVGLNPYGLSVTPDGTKLLVANRTSNTVNVINTATNTVTDTIAVGNNPYAFGNFIIIGCNLVQPTIFPDGNLLRSSSLVNNQWYRNDTIIDGATSQNYSVSLPVSDTLCFTVSITDNAGCSAISEPYCYYPLSVGFATEANNPFYIYPNPVTYEITVNGYSPAYLKLCNAVGQIVAESKSNKLYVGNLSQGLYVLQLFDAAGQQVKTEKVIVAK